MSIRVPPDLGRRRTRGWTVSLRRVEATFADGPISPWYWYAVAAAMLLGMALRFWDLAGVPPGLQQDEAVYGYDAYSLFKTGRDHLGHPFPFVSLETFGDWSSPLLTFLMVPFVAVFGLHPEVLRSVTVLAGATIVPVVFLLGVIMFQRPAVGAVAAGLLAVWPVAVHLSRWAIIPSLAPAMIALTLLAFVWAMRNRSERGFVLAALLAGLTVASYYGMRLYVPLALIPGLFIFRRTIVKLRLEALAYGALLFTVIAGPILYLSLRDPGGGARFAQTSIFEQGDVTASLLADQYLSYFSPSFWFSNGDWDAMHLTSGVGLAPWSLLPLLAAGVAALIVTAWRKRDAWRRRTALLIIVLLVLYPVPGALTLPNPDMLRAAHVLPLAVLVAGLGAVSAFDVLRFRLAGQPVLQRSLAGVLAVVLVLAAVAELTPRYGEYFGSYRQEVGPSFHAGLEPALRYVFEHEAEVDEIRIDESVHSSYIYVLFYKPWEPSDVHRSLEVTRNPPQWNEVHGIGKYRFDIPAGVPDEALKQRFASRYEDDSPAFEVLSGISAEGVSFLYLRLARR